VIGDPSINLVVIATRHNTHADLVCSALSNGHNVFLLRSPLADDDVQLDSVLEAARSSSAKLMVGSIVDFHRMRMRFLNISKKSHRSIINFVSRKCRSNPDVELDSGPERGRRGGSLAKCVTMIWSIFLTGSVTTRVFAEAIVSRNSEVVDEDSVFYHTEVGKWVECFG